MNQAREERIILDLPTDKCEGFQFNDERAKNLLKTYVAKMIENIKKERKFYLANSLKLEIKNSLFTQRNGFENPTNENLKLFFRRHIIASKRDLNIEGELAEKIEAKLINEINLYLFSKISTIDLLKINFSKPEKIIYQTLEKKHKRKINPKRRKKINSKI